MLAQRDFDLDPGSAASPSTSTMRPTGSVRRRLHGEPATTTSPRARRRIFRRDVDVWLMRRSRANKRIRLAVEAPDNAGVIRSITSTIFASARPRCPPRLRTRTGRRGAPCASRAGRDSLASSEPEAESVGGPRRGRDEVASARPGSRPSVAHDLASRSMPRAAAERLRRRLIPAAGELGVVRDAAFASGLQMNSRLASVSYGGFPLALRSPSGYRCASRDNSQLSYKSALGLKTGTGAALSPSAE